MIEIQIQVNPGKLSFFFPQTGKFYQVPSLAVLDKPNGRIIALGDEAIKLKEKTSEALPKQYSNATFVYPFEPVQFDSTQAWAILWYFILLFLEINPYMIPLILLIRGINLDLQIRQYEIIDLNQRLEFERSLQKPNPVRRLSINGNCLKRPFFEALSHLANH